MSEELRNRVVSVLVGVGVLAFAVVADRFLFAANVAQERRHVEELLSGKRAILQHQLNQVIHLPVGLGALVQSHRRFDQPIGQAEFNAFAAALARDYPYIRSLRLAPDGRISLVSPLKGNEHTLGLNLLTRGESRVAALRARDTGAMVMEGPTPAALGDRALIVHYPIFLRSAESEVSSFWGFASIVIDFAGVLERSGWREVDDVTQVAIRTEGSENQPGERIFGTSGVFPSQPVELTLALPHATWRLAAIPNAGWSKSWPGRMWLVLSALVLAALAMLATLRILDQARRLRVNERIFRELAVRDGLTGLYNRRGLDELLDREWSRCRRQGKPISIVMCDIDFFKQYNDAYGHAAGDDCLRSVASKINNSRGRATDVVARFGGEEFVIVLPEVDAAGAIHVGEAARRDVLSLAIPHSVSPFRTVTMSVGVATMVPGEKKFPGDLLAEADFGLYGAKQGGRNQVLMKSLVDQREGLDADVGAPQKSAAAIKRAQPRGLHH